MLVNTQNFSARRFGPSLSGLANVRPPVIVHFCQVLHFQSTHQIHSSQACRHNGTVWFAARKKYAEKNTTPRIHMNIYGVLTIALIGEVQGVDVEMQGVDTLHARRGRP